jgi:hypothetical protein
MSGSVESFRISFWVLWAYVVIAATGIGVPLALALVACLGLWPPWDKLVVAVGGGVGVAEISASLLLLVYIAYFKVTVGPDGLGGFNSWGGFRKFAWADISSVRRINLLGLPYLRVYAEARKASLGLPLFLRDRERFCRLVRAYAGPEHPVARALYEDLTSERASPVSAEEAARRRYVP